MGRLARSGRLTFDQPFSAGPATGLVIVRTIGLLHPLQPIDQWCKLFKCVLRYGHVAGPEFLAI